MRTRMNGQLQCKPEIELFMALASILRNRKQLYVLSRLKIEPLEKLVFQPHVLLERALSVHASPRNDTDEDDGDDYAPADYDQTAPTAPTDSRKLLFHNS